MSEKSKSKSKGKDKDSRSQKSHSSSKNKDKDKLKDSMAKDKSKSKKTHKGKNPTEKTEKTENDNPSKSLNNTSLSLNQDDPITNATPSFNKDYYDKLISSQPHFNSQPYPYQSSPLSKSNPFNYINPNQPNGQIPPQNPEKCEGCYKGDGEFYCADCNKIYCKICERQIHVVPANRTHDIKPVTEMYSLKKLCYHHNSILKYFCETCEEPICYDCQMIGPHNNKLHKISSVIESYKKKFQYIYSLVNRNLNKKYEESMNQISYLDYLTDQIRGNKNKIERITRSEYSEVIEELNCAEGKKIAIINYESSILQKDATKMQEIINYVNDLAGGDINDNDMINFLLKYKQINDMIELCISKPIKKKLEINSDDFPRRIEENKLKISQYDNMIKLSKIKDDIIWKILHDNNIKKSKYINNMNNINNMSNSNSSNNINNINNIPIPNNSNSTLLMEKEKEINDIKQKTKIELDEWAKLSDRYAAELQKYSLVCYYCGCCLDENTVNSNCEVNNNSSMNNINDEGNSNNYYGVTVPPAEFNGSYRHFFCAPKNDFLNNRNNDKIFDNNNNINNNNNNQLWFNGICQQLAQNKNGLIDGLNLVDSDHDGFINQGELITCFNNLGINISNNQCDYLLMSLAINNKDGFAIKDFVQNLDKINGE